MFLRSVLFVTLALAAGAFAGAAQAQSEATGNQTRMMTQSDLITRILTDGAANADMFSASFLQAVPIEQVNAILSATRQAIGIPTAVEFEGDGFEVTTNTHRMTGSLTLNSDGRIAGLLLQPPVAVDATLSDAVTTLLGFEGETALLITRNGQALETHQADQKLAIGSAFKLGVLAALAQQIAEGTHKWDDVVVLEARHRSLPSGLLQTMPEGAPLTLHSVASLMIAQSDNTATDLLIDIVGRAAVNDVLGDFILSTREFFQLKADPALLADFVAAQDEPGKLAVLARLTDRPLPTVADVLRPHNPGAEWYLTATTLCALIEAVSDLDMVSINPGVADPARWQHVAFKGGSEIGVINLTTRLVNDAGDVYCASYTLNKATAIDEAEIGAAFGTLVTHLEDL